MEASSSDLVSPFFHKWQCTLDLLATLIEVPGVAIVRLARRHLVCVASNRGNLVGIEPGACWDLAERPMLPHIEFPITCPRGGCFGYLYVFGWTERQECADAGHIQHVRALLEADLRFERQEAYRMREAAARQDRLETEIATLQAALLGARATAVAAGHGREQFLASMSHELRTPLNAIMGFAEVIADDLFGPCDSSRYAAAAADILASARQLLDSLDDILKLAGLVGGQPDAAIEEIDTADLVDRVMAEMRPVFQKAGVTTETGIEAGCERIATSAHNLAIILRCLLSNAAKFSERGTSAEVWVRRAAGDSVDFIIRDHGIGMAPHHLDHVMKPFMQVEDVYCKKRPGCGLGLTLVQMLTGSLGGTVAVESTLGIGTTVTVSLPAQPISLLPWVPMGRLDCA